MRLLIIDHNKTHSLLLKEVLFEENFAIDLAHDGVNGCYLAKTTDYDLILIDPTIPGKSGCTICKEIRGMGKTTPIIGISSATDLESKLELFGAGADDCIVKPYSCRELVARIRANLRRGSVIHPDCLKAGGLVLNRSLQKVTLNSRPIALTPKEFSILELLLLKKGVLISRTEFCEHIWDRDLDPFSHTLESHVHCIRKKLGNDGRDLIRSVPGRGYVIESN